MAYSSLDLTIADGIATLTFNRPKALNALNTALLEELVDALNSIGKDETIRELYGWMKSHLAEHKMPSRWWAIDAIPRTSRGKINREAVKTACTKMPALDLPSILSRKPGA